MFKDFLKIICIFFCHNAKNHNKNTFQHFIHCHRFYENLPFFKRCNTFSKISAELSDDTFISTTCPHIHPKSG